MSDKRVMAMVGKPGSGKSTFCSYLPHDTVGVVSLRYLMKSAVESRGLEWSDQNAHIVGNELVGANPYAVGEMILGEVEQIPQRYAVVEGIRGIDEITYLRMKLGDQFHVVELQAPSETRLRRILRRAKKEGRAEIKNSEDLTLREQREAGYGMDDVLSAADYHISTYRMKRNSMPQVFEKLVVELWGD